MLVNPGKRCSTEEVFRLFRNGYRHPLAMPQSLPNLNEFIDFLEHQENALMPAALEVVPEIAFTLKTLEDQRGCLFARMSGSGATCFALFSNEADAKDAAKDISKNHPDWWVKAGTMNRPERY